MYIKLREMQPIFVDIIFVVVLATIRHTFCQNACKTDFRIGSDRTTCYRVFGSNAEWDVAEKRCNSLRGHLVHITSEQKNWDILNEMKKRGLIKIWLGVKETPGPWKWVTDQVELSDQGCYTDKNGSRDLEVMEKIPDLTVSKCIDFCQRRQYRYAGVQDGSDCWCGNSFGKHGFSQDCRIPCKGDMNVYCGGEESNRIYNVNGGFSMWNLGQPNNHEGYSTCGAFDKIYDYKWNDVRCTERYPVLCSTEQTSSQCIGTGRMFLANRCFIAVSDPHSWYEGRKKCKRLGGDYAVIKDARTQKLLQNSMLAQKFTGIGFWIGLSRAQWSWTSGQSLSFSLWNRGSPNGAGQNCAAISDDGSWTDVVCENRYAYICEIDPLATTTTTTTTTPPPTTTEAPTTEALTTEPSSLNSERQPVTFWTKEMLGTVGGVAAGVAFLTVVIILIVIISKRKSKPHSGDSTSVLDPEEEKQEPEDDATQGYFFGLDKTPITGSKAEEDSEENLTNNGGDQPGMESTLNEENGHVVHDSTEKSSNLTDSNDCDKTDRDNRSSHVYEKLIRGTEEDEMKKSDQENVNDTRESKANNIKSTKKGTVRFENEEDDGTNDNVGNDKKR